MTRISKFPLVPFVMVLALWATFGASRASATGECTPGVNVFAYNGECAEVDIDEGTCTTRMEQTPPSTWCCCPDGYVPSDPKNDQGCSLSVAAAKTTSPVSTLKALRGVRDNVLAKSDKGKEYIALFYKHTGAIAKILLANPALVRDGAKLLDKDLAFLAALAKDGSAEISKAEIEAVRNFLQRVVAAAQDPDLRAAIKRVSTDLANSQILQGFGIKVKG